MTTEELLAMTEQGPKVVMSSREDMVSVLRELRDLRLHRDLLASENERLTIDNRRLWASVVSFAVLSATTMGLALMVMR